MAYEFEIRDLTARPIATIERRVKVEEIGPTLMEILPEVWRTVEAQGGTPATPPFAVYENFDQGSTTIKGGAILEAPIAGDHPVVPGELPQCRAAVTLHIGPYERIPEAYEAFQKWLADEGESWPGGSWEIYWTDPAEELDSSKWKTEIFFPLA